MARPVTTRSAGGDALLTLLCLLATGIGLLAIWDAGYARAAAAGKIFPREFWMQAIFTVAALFMGFWVGRSRPAFMQRAAPYWFGLAFLGLLLVEVPGIGKTIAGATRWIGFGPFTIQPAEFMKLAAILFLASSLTRPAAPTRNQRPRHWGETLDFVILPAIKRSFPYALVMIAIVVIEKEPDLATAMVIAASAFFMLIAKPVRAKVIVSIIALLGIGATIMTIQEPYRMARITNHAERWSPENIDGVGFQTTQSEAVLAAGGWFGVGLGNGRAKHTLPAPTTDFILATIGEEFGLVGSLVMTLLMAAIAGRLVLLAFRRTEPFPRLVLVGVGGWIAIQASTNIMMAYGTLPPIGIPLPFVSYGGSSLIALWMAIGTCQALISGVEEVEHAPTTGRDRWRNGRARISRA